MHKPVQDILKEIETVQAEIDGYEIRANEATTEAEKLESTSHDDLINNPAKAEQITIKVMSAHRMQQAFEAKAAEGREKIEQLRRKALEVEADELDKDAERLERNAEKHKDKIEKLLAEVSKQDGPTYKLHDGSRTYGMRQQAKDARFSAAMNRYYLLTGEKARSAHDLRNKIDGTPPGPTGVLEMESAFLLDDKPTELLLAVMAGQDLPSVPA